MTWTQLTLVQTRIHWCQVQEAGLPSPPWHSSQTRTQGAVEAVGVWEGMGEAEGGGQVPLRVLQRPHALGQLTGCLWASVSSPIARRGWSEISPLHTFPRASQGRGKGRWVPMPGALGWANNRKQPPQTNIHWNGQTFFTLSQKCVLDLHSVPKCVLA